MDIKVPDKPWKRSQPDPWLLRNGQVIDVVTGTTSRKDILIEGGRFKKIQDPGSFPASFRCEAQVDLEGAYVCPGLIDCHVHVSVVPGLTDLSRIADISPAYSTLRQPYLCRQILSRGFTTVRDCGGATGQLKDAIQDGVFPGPRLFIAGRALSQTGGHVDWRRSHEEIDYDRCGCHQNIAGQVCDGVPACLEAARDQLRRGADFIKIVAGGGVMSPTDKLTSVQFTAEEIQAISSVAKASGTYVTAHAYTPASIQHCIANGVEGIEHGNLMDRETAELMARKGVFLTPTLVTYKMMAALAESAIAPESAAKNQEVLKVGIDSLRLADDAGVTICHGSDLLGSLWAAQTHEFAIRSQALSPLKVLQSATLNAARLLRAESELGQVKEGFLADLLVLRKNPLEDITALDRSESELEAVVKEGKVFMVAKRTIREQLAKAGIEYESKL